MLTNKASSSAKSHRISIKNKARDKSSIHRASSCRRSTEKKRRPTSHVKIIKKSHTRYDHHNHRNDDQKEEEKYGACYKRMIACNEHKIVIVAFILTFISGLLIGSFFDFYGRCNHKSKFTPIWRYDSQPAGKFGQSYDKRYPQWRDYDPEASKKIEAAFQGATEKRVLEPLKIRTSDGKMDEYRIEWKTTGTQLPIVPDGRGGYRTKKWTNGEDQGYRIIKLNPLSASIFFKSIFTSMNGNNHYYGSQSRIDPQIIECQRNLPVYAYKDRIVQKVKKNSIVLIVGETGSGKTTQIPQYLLQWSQVSPSKQIVCTQPRKVAAQSVARRVAEEVGDKGVGKTIGYHVRLDCNVKPDETKLVYMTEGVLLRKAMSCDNLANYKVVIIDEAHERTVNADLLMGFLKKMVRARANTTNKLHVIIMSATLDTERFKKYFDVHSDDIIQVPGSANPVQHHWCHEPTDDYKKLSKQLILAIHKDGVEKKNGKIIPDGHILVFLTGRKDIDEVVAEVQKDEKCLNEHGHLLEIHALYSQLPPDKQTAAFREPDKKTTRKCVVATNIAETSLTINNVVYVIDCGLSKQKMYSPSKGLEVLAVRGISKASVQQRVGRAGRVRPGVAYHLYTQQGYENLQNETPAEILRSGLVNEMLSLLALGISNPLKFDFIDAPNEMTMARALHILKNLKAINDEGKITEIGRQMASFPVNPRMAKSIVAAMTDFNCVYEMIVIAAMLEVEDRLWIKPLRQDDKGNAKRIKKEFYHSSGDHLTLLNVFNAYMAVHPDDRSKFCAANYLNKSQLERAVRIRGQIEKDAINIRRKQQQDENEQKQHNDYYQQQQAVFKLNGIEYEGYYENIIKALLSGHFMNIAVKGFGDNYWRFRLLDLDDHNKAIDIVDKAKCHQNSMFDKNNSMNWVIYADVSISHTTQLKILTAIKPKWLLEIDSNSYYTLEKLKNDETPIAKILRSCEPHI